VDTQTAHLVALKFGIYRDREVMAKGLRRRMLADCRRLRGGFVGSTMMNTVLAENGMEQMAYDLLFFEGFPGWLYAVNMGATTIWERWNSVLPDGSISGTGMNSLNHYSYGSVMEFMFRCSAGICPVEPAFRKVRIQPLPERRLGFVECSFDSAFGKYVSNWEICQDGKLKFHIEIPFRCTAEVCLPEREPMQLDAGSYDFTIETQRDYRALYTPDTPLGELVKDPRAVEIIERNIPKLLNNIHTIVEPGTTLVDILDESVPMNMVYRSCSLIQAWKEIETDRIKDVPMYEKTIEEICALR
jgi:alpha-L-rhamnosidase